MKILSSLEKLQNLDKALFPRKSKLIPLIKELARKRKEKMKNYKEDQVLYYKTILEAISSRSSCDRRKVGAIIVRDKIIISTGFNGSPRGLPHCNENHLYEDPRVGDHCLRTIHAEVNSILGAARNGVSIAGADMFCTDEPCFQCMKVIINSGIVRCFYFNEYSDEFQSEFRGNSFCKFIRMVI